MIFLFKKLFLILPLKKQVRAFLLIGLFVFSMSSNTAVALTGAPSMLHHQGRLLDSSGNLLGGSGGTNYCFKFSFYDDPAIGAPDNKLWPSTSSSKMTVIVTNGVFDVDIGDTLVGGDNLDFDFSSTDEIYLNVEVANSSGGSCVGVTSFENLSPRQRIVSSGYALNSNKVGGFTPSQTPTANQIPVLNSSGNLDFAGSVISGGLTVNGAATATTFNGLTLTSATTGFTIAGGTTSKTLTLSNTLTLAGIDGSTLNIGTGGTLGTAAFTDASAYLTSLSGAVLTDQTTPQTIGDTTNRLAKLWATDITVTNAIAGNITGSSGSTTGNAATVTNGVYTNAANSFSLINPITTLAESWIGPSSTTGIYFKGGNVGIGTTAPGELLSLGLAGTTGGVISLAGATSGKAIINVLAAAGTPTLTLPTTTGTLALTSDITGDTTHLLLDQSTPQTIGDTTNRLAKLWATDITVTNAIAGDITGSSGSTTGNAATVTGLSITSGKSLSVSNILTLEGTDGSTLNIGTGGTLGTAAFTDASAYLTSLSGAVLTDQTTPQTIGDTTNRLAKLWATDITVTNAITGDITGSSGSTTGNAATVTGLTITSGKSLSVSNILTLSGTDGSTLNIGTGGTLGTNAFTSTAYVPTTRTVNGHALSGNVSVTPTDLSLVIGTNVQAYNANLTAINQALTTTSSPTFTSVGIGTAAPGTKLDVNGSVRFSGATNGSPVDGEFVYDTSTHAYKYYNSDTATWMALTGGTISVTGGYWAQSGTNLSYIAGNVGIGTTTPSELLSLGLSGTTGGVLSLAGSSSGKIIIQSPATITDYTLTLPDTVGGAGTVLTDVAGNGVLSWVASSGGAGVVLTNQTTPQTFINGIPLLEATRTFTNQHQLVDKAYVDYVFSFPPNPPDPYAGPNWDQLGVTQSWSMGFWDTVQTMDWANMNINSPLFSFNFTNTGGTAGTDSGVVINNAVSTNATDDLNTENLLLIQQLDTTNTGTTVVDNAIKIDVVGNSGMTNGLIITNSAGDLTNGINIVDTTEGTLTTGILMAGTFTSILDTPSIDISGDGVISGATGITSSGTITLSGFVTQGYVCTDASGVLSAGGVSCSTSSLRFKHDIENLNGNLDKVLALRAVSFTYNNNNINDIGFVAEEVELIEPRLVTYEADGITPHGLNYAQFAPLLVGAIQEMNLKVQDISDLLNKESLTVLSLIEQSLEDTTNWVSKIFAKTVVTEGIQIKDSSTGEWYCVMITNGEFNKVKGECGTVLPAGVGEAGIPLAPPETTPTTDTTTTEEIIPEEDSSSDIPADTTEASPTETTPPTTEEVAPTDTTSVVETPVSAPAPDETPTP